jgi:hypothetical protein
MATTKLSTTIAGIVAGATGATGPTGATGATGASGATTTISNGTSNLNIATSGGVIYANTAGTNAVTINTSQNVGIGTTAPVAKLDVENTSAKPFGTAAQLNTIFKGSVSVGEGGAIGFDYFGSHTNCPTSIGYAVESQSGLTKGSLVFGTRSVTTDTAPSERMRLDSSGSVGIGVTPDTNFFLTVQSTSDDNKNAIKVNQASTATRYQITFNNPNGMVGSISTTGSATSYTTSSDYRLKENITPMTGALAKVTQLKPVTYKWKVDGSDGEVFIAHELAEVCPQAVAGTKDAVDTDNNPIHQGVDTSFLVATLTAAIQELNAKVESLESRLGT